MNTMDNRISLIDAQDEGLASHFTAHKIIQTMPSTLFY